MESPHIDEYVNRVSIVHTILRQGQNRNFSIPVRFSCENEKIRLFIQYPSVFR